MLATLHGDPRVLLAAERMLLNFLQRLSGIATHTRRHVAALGSGRTRLLDTRKTTPGYRMLEKYAVACGGGWNHRLGLFDRVMLKDNHLALLGFGPAAPAVRRSGPRFRVLASSQPRTQNSERRTLPPPGRGGVAAARRNAPGCRSKSKWTTPARFPRRFPPAPTSYCSTISRVPQLRRAVALVAGRAFTEASGGVTLRTLPRLRGLGLDFVSTGALVHHSVWADIGLDWRP